MTSRFTGTEFNAVTKKPFGATPRHTRGARDAGHQSLLLRRNARSDRRANRAF